LEDNIKVDLKYGESVEWIDLNQDPVVSSCADGNKSSDAIRDAIFLDHLSNYQFLYSKEPFRIACDVHEDIFKSFRTESTTKYTLTTIKTP
jgi:hypothetical protein